jgi:hypothetical protein
MDKPTPIPISKSVRAAQYVRMSTEHQQYSTENQAEVIARYAAEHGMEIVATYEDSGKSGLTLTGREELKRLLADAESGTADFSVILVYDVSRWGRFLDADESAYHEYVCKRAGVGVHYPAEQFKNDGSPITTYISSAGLASDFICYKGDRCDSFGMRLPIQLAVISVLVTNTAVAQYQPMQPSNSSTAVAPQTATPAAIAVSDANADRSTMFSISSSDSYTNGTKQQQTYMGSALISRAYSQTFCDLKTKQYGAFATASDSISKSSTPPAIAVIADEGGAEFLKGFPEVRQKGNLTRNYFSLTSDYYLNNSLGIGLQQLYTGQYMRFLTRCDAKRFFAASGIGAGFADQRLYATSARLNSAVLPISGQFSIIVPPRASAVSPNPNPPKAVISAQVGYTPFLNQLHAYQIYENSTLVLPTEWTHLTIQVLQSNFYLNNAPTKFKRDYQAYGIQVTFTYTKPPQAAPAGSSNWGACYTADKSSHMFCYDNATQNACVPPSIFRVHSSCGAAAVPFTVRTQ